jgi:hypothetical protein
VLDAQRAGPVGQRARRALIAARRPADAEIDPTREQRLQHPELLRDLQRTVVIQHDAAGADANARRAGGDVPDEDLGTGAGEPRRRMMLGEPVAVVAEPVTDLGELERLADGVGGRAAATDR